MADTGKATVAVRKGQGSFSTVTSGQASGAITLDMGANAITVRVTAEDTTTTKDYTVTITRRTAGQTTPTVSLSAPSRVVEGSSVTVTARLSGVAFKRGDDSGDGPPHPARTRRNQEMSIERHPSTSASARARPPARARSPRRRTPTPTTRRSRWRWTQRTCRRR